MAALVASPIIFNSRNDLTTPNGTDRDHPPPLANSTTRSEHERLVRGNDIFAKAIAQAEQGTGQNALARLTSNPVVFVEASDPSPSSLSAAIAGNSKYELLDDSKLSSTPTQPDSKPNANTNGVKKFIGPIIPETIQKEREDNTSSSEPSASSSTPPKVLYTPEIPSTWPTLRGALPIPVGRGLDNVGNTCFLNSVLQCLLHTTGLLHIVIEHRLQDMDCLAQAQNGFCMLCEFSKVVWQTLYAQNRKTYTQPASILGSLGKIAKGLRRGRQEDAHEFLRYSIDAFQKAALAGQDPKLPHSVKETTWVHKLFGGRLRSRVTCQVCHHNSDTFDSVLDLSIDVRDKDSVREALESFVAVERLTGADKYKCEKCKKPVVAEKRFSIHEAPQILTVHLKRFTPMGRKLTHQVQYPETLSLQRFMSEGQYGPTYDLYGIICHQGSGPNSGHYFAFAKSPKGQWHEMNDEEIRYIGHVPSVRTAYLLFYMRRQGSTLQSAIQNPSNGVRNFRDASTSSATDMAPAGGFGGLAAPVEIFSASDRAEKRKREQATKGAIGDDDEDLGVKASPHGDANGASPASKKPRVGDTPPDPAAASLKARIDAVIGASKAKMAATTSQAGPSSQPAAPKSPSKASQGPLLAEYESSEPDDSDLLGPPRPPTDEDSVVRLSTKNSTLTPPTTPPRSVTQPLANNISSRLPTPPPSSSDPARPSSTQQATDLIAPIAPVSFYGNSDSSSSAYKGKQRSLDENDKPYPQNRAESSYQPSSSQHHSHPHNHNRDYYRRDNENDRGNRFGSDDRNRGDRDGGERSRTPHPLKKKSINPWNSMGKTSVGGGSSGGSGNGGSTARQRMNRRKPLM